MQTDTKKESHTSPSGKIKCIQSKCHASEMLWHFIAFGEFRYLAQRILRQAKRVMQSIERILYSTRLI